MGPAPVSANASSGFHLSGAGARASELRPVDSAARAQPWQRVAIARVARVAGSPGRGEVLAAGDCDGDGDSPWRCGGGGLPPEVFAGAFPFACCCAVRAGGGVAHRGALVGPARQRRSAGAPQYQDERSRTPNVATCFGADPRGSKRSAWAGVLGALSSFASTRGGGRAIVSSGRGHGHAATPRSS
eukprot:6312269-Alexandrium_andersonii.AAC.1